MALERGRDNLGAIQKILADGGYTGKAFASSVQELIGAEVRDCQKKRIAPFCSIAEAMGSRAQLFLVGKEQAALENCERKLSTSLQMVALAFLGVLLRRL